VAPAVKLEQLTGFSRFLKEYGDCADAW